MILILDACTVSNLVNVYQDDSLLKAVKSGFNAIYITKEVIKEIDENKYSYVHLYKDRESVRQLVYDLSLSNFVCSHDTHKSDCISFIRRYASKKNIILREQDGEFYSTLLALYTSRLGDIEFYENNNKILFATDDYGAKKLYSNLFQTNQVGKIIDSIDIVCVLHLKKILTKNEVVKFIDGIIALYSQSIFTFRKMVEHVRLLNQKDSKLQAHLTKLIEWSYSLDIDNLSGTKSKNEYKNLYSSYPKLKIALEDILNVSLDRKLDYIKERRRDIVNDLFWVA